MNELIIAATVGQSWVSFIAIIMLLGRTARLNQRLRLIEQEMSYSKFEYNSLKRKLETRMGLLAEL